MTTSRMLGTVFSAMLLWTTAATAQDTPRTMLQAGRKQARQAVGLKDEARADVYRKAIAIYELVEKKWPKAVDEISTALLRIGELSDKIGETSRAMESLDRCIAMQGPAATRAAAWMQKAKIFRRQRKARAQREALTAVAEKFADEKRLASQAWLRLASLNLKERRWKDAEAAAQKVLDRFPERWRDNVDACNRILRGLIMRHRWVDAIKRLEDLDRFLMERFADHKKRSSIEKAMARMSARKTLTPVPDE